MTEDDFESFTGRGILTEAEGQVIAKYTGFKPFLPLKWALAEARRDLGRQMPEDPGKNGAPVKTSQLPQPLLTTYLTLERSMFTLRSHCSQMFVKKMQPIPFAYFHGLKIAVILVLISNAYWLVQLLEGRYLTSIVTFGSYAGVILGIQEVAVAMSDPFGDDDVDFDLATMANGAYANATAYLADRPQQDITQGKNQPSQSLDSTQPSQSRPNTPGTDAPLWAWTSTAAELQASPLKPMPRALRPPEVQVYSPSFRKAKKNQSAASERIGKGCPGMFSCYSGSVPRYLAPPPRCMPSKQSYSASPANTAAAQARQLAAADGAGESRESGSAREDSALLPKNLEMSA